MVERARVRSSVLGRRYAVKYAIARLCARAPEHFASLTLVARCSEDHDHRAHRDAVEGRDIGASAFDPCGGGAYPVGCETEAAGSADVPDHAGSSERGAARGSCRRLPVRLAGEPD